MIFKQYLFSAHIDIYLDKITNIGYAIWKDYCSDSEYVDALLTQEKMIKEEKIKFLLCDLRKFKGTTIDNAMWTKEEIEPRIYNSTLKKIAYINGESIFGNFTLTIIKKKIESDGILQTNTFKETESAIAWLNEPILELK